MTNLIDRIDSEIKAGLKNELPRLENARVNHDFYRADFSAHDPRIADGIYEEVPYIRTAPVMRRIVQVLAEHLYAKGPARSLPGSKAASDWLADLYSSEGADALLQEADRLAMVADVAAIEVYGIEEGDSDRRIGLRLWPAHQFIVWEDPDDALRPVAVGVLDFYDETRRLRVWTTEQVRTYATNKAGPGQTAGGTAFFLVDEEENPYGIIPFAFVHANRPTTCFWSGSPGDGLVEMNEYINYRLTDTGDGLRYCGKPITTIFGVGENWHPDTPVKPGAIWFPPPSGIDAAGNGIPPSIESFVHDLGFVEASWADLQGYLDLTLEANNVPKAAIRLAQGEAASGVAIVAEQLPLILAAQARQRPALDYERRLARVALAVGSALGLVDADPAIAASLTARWPSMVPEVPQTGTDADKADEWALALKILSRIQLVMKRFNMSRDEAIAHLRQVAEDLAEEQRLGLAEPAPAPDDPAAMRNQAGTDQTPEDIQADGQDTEGRQDAP